MSDTSELKLKANKLEPKSMFLAVRVGDGPVRVWPTIQYLDTKERIWETKDTPLAKAARCAIGFTEDSARGLLMWGPFQGSSNSKTSGFEPDNAGASPAP